MKNIFLKIDRTWHIRRENKWAKVAKRVDTKLISEDIWEEVRDPLWMAKVLYSRVIEELFNKKQIL